MYIHVHTSVFMARKHTEYIEKGAGAMLTHSGSTVNTIGTLAGAAVDCVLMVIK